MHTPGTAAATQRFEAPELHFSDLSAEVLAGVVAAATDLALVVDAQGVIRDVSLGAAHAAEGFLQGFRGEEFGRVEARGE